LDLKYFLYREQVSLMRAERASCSEARHAHRALARAYGELVVRLQSELAVVKTRQTN